MQAKTYHGGSGEWYSLDLDYPRIAALLAKDRLPRLVALEMEARKTRRRRVPKNLTALRGVFQAVNDTLCARAPKPVQLKTHRSTSPPNIDVLGILQR